MRKTIGLIISVLLLLSLTPHAFAEQTNAAYCVLSPQANAAVAEREADVPHGAAGLCKLPAILTLCLAVDRGLLATDATVTVGRAAASIGGPTAFLKSGEQIDAEQLLEAAVMISAGDAIWALMEHAFGSEDVFLQNIALTLKDAGIDHSMQRALGSDETFTCTELAMIGGAAMNSATFMRFCSTKYAVLHHQDGRETELANANKLLSSLSGCIGLLTGSSNTDGYCGVFACKRGDTTFLCAITGAQNSKARFSLATQLFEEAFANYSVSPLVSLEEPVLEAYPVEGGDVETVDLYAKESIALLLKKSDGQPKMDTRLPEVLTAPLDPDFAVGSVAFLDPDGTVLFEVAVYPKNAVSATGFREILKRILTVYRNG